jgi:SAM-dependent MidA family methyltransferase
MSSELPLLPILREEIRARGPILFARFMELCLYHPEFGYYNSGRAKLGASGDFYTSAHVAPVFARILARHFERVWERLGRPARFDLVELGPGDGSLARELLSWARGRHPAFFASLCYTGVEQSAHLRGKIEEGLRHFGGRAQVVADFAEQAHGPAEAGSWLRQQPRTTSPGVCGCVFANEFFDALPVHILVWRRGRWRERLVAVKAGRLVWVEREPSLADLSQQAELCCDPSLPKDARPNGWAAEIRPQAGEWLKRIAAGLAQGEVLIVDYGYTLDEWRGGRFPEGSALAYRGHQVAEDLLGHPGDQDLTAHVNFTELAEAGKASGLRLRSLETQAKFLVTIGEPDEFADVFADCASEAERQRRAQLLKTLILPQGMGEAFRVLRMEK